MEDERYFVALVRIYDRALTFVSNLPAAERAAYLERLDKLRPRSRHVWRTFSMTFGTPPTSMATREVQTRRPLPDSAGLDPKRSIGQDQIASVFSYHQDPCWPGFIFCTPAAESDHWADHHLPRMMSLLLVPSFTAVDLALRR
jgi:hypothetical protein